MTHPGVRKVRQDKDLDDSLLTFLRSRLLPNPLKDARHRGLDLLPRDAKTIPATIIGILDACLFRSRGVEAAQQTDFLLGHPTGDETGHMPRIHGDEEVSVGVHLAELAGPVLATVVTMRRQFFEGTVVRPITNMPAAQPTGRDDGVIGEAGIVNVVAEDDFAHGGAADVSGTHNVKVQASLISHEHQSNDPRRPGTAGNSTLGHDDERTH